MRYHKHLHNSLLTGLIPPLFLYVNANDVKIENGISTDIIGINGLHISGLIGGNWYQNISALNLGTYNTITSVLII